ncbi:probable xyloglucan endotransglucosylase/hydrolase protein 25 isoform X2 [Selaginella moellendorffii]|uniref:probable xyloglucan endotransglucosylase/hydrolase protein 25 isoform X2 n=1 Tax=Selaginella moellendorffii TaxID=88036 RepID=UPI000D1C8A0F|nr:probable xyloglucan endotransglucosylase/hydrolase protein 25 isoform X2 [Selaginella moellendorffii]|eukprot:XP_024515248.1 probable xyloglucan endotransglucosylase/hydrolase protein 25 isoform X2 [Selaginella moellendorffii]
MAAFLHRRKKKKVMVALIVAAIAILVIGGSVGAARRARSSSSSSSSSSASSFSGNYDITWAPDHVDVIGHGQEVDLRLDRDSGAGFGSKDRFLFGQLGLQIKLVPYDSSGTIVAYMLSSLTDDRDELDFEFLGNSTGQSYTLQTNLFVSGKGKREQRFKLWFDPTADFHFYSFVWNPFQIHGGRHSSPGLQEHHGSIPEHETHGNLHEHLGLLLRGLGSRSIRSVLPRIYHRRLPILRDFSR